jgi:lipoprotein-releasing system permease protein
VRNWYELEKSRYVSFRTTKNLLVFIMSLIICVAAINIASSLVMVSIERRYEIAILMGLGSRKNQIAAAFIIMGFISGLAGTFIGLTIGLLLALRINELIALVELVINAALRLFSFISAPFKGAEAVEITLINPDYYLSEIPVVIRLPEIVFVAALAVLLSTVASFFPARRAAGIDPMEVLQKH